MYQCIFFTKGIFFCIRYLFLSLENKSKNKDLALFIYGLRSLPFYPELKSKTIELNPNYSNLTNDIKTYL